MTNYTVGKVQIRQLYSLPSSVEDWLGKKARKLSLSSLAAAVATLQELEENVLLQFFKFQLVCAQDEEQKKVLLLFCFPFLNELSFSSQP